MRRLLRRLPRLAGDGPPGARLDGPDAAAAPAARHRAERRAVARRLHPDLGGDVEEYLAALAEVDRAHGVGAGGGTGEVRFPGARARRTGLRRRLNRAVRATRQRLPRHAPGARRYARL